MWELRALDLVTWAVLAAGWIVFDWLARARDRTNRCSSQVDDAVARVEEIEESALRFWHSPGADSDQQDLQRRMMIMKIDHLERRVTELGNKRSSFGCNSEINGFLKSILDDDGESLDRAALRSDDPRFERIAEAAKILTNKLRTAR